MSTPMNKETYFKVSGIFCHGLPLFGRTEHVDGLYVVVVIDDQFRWTNNGKYSHGATEWGDELYFDMTMMDEGYMTIQIWASHFMGEDKLVGESSGPINVSSLLATDSNTGIQEPLFKTDKNGQKQEAGSIRMITLCTNRTHTPLDLRTKIAKKAIFWINKSQKTTKHARALLSGAGTPGPGFKKMQATYNVWKQLVQNIETFVSIMDSASQIDLHVQMAWSALSLPLKAIITQTKRDKKIQSLLEAMNDIYSFTLRAGPLKLVKKHQETIRLMCQQTAECAFFISGYASHGSDDQMASSLKSSNNNEISEYEKRFKQLKHNFRFKSITITEIAVFQMTIKSDQVLTKVYQMTNEIQCKEAVIRLDGIYYAKNRFQPEGCLIGTRKTAIRHIVRWFSRPIDDNTRVYWLSGTAGCGKSAVARSVADQLAAQRRCVSFFFHASRRADDGPDQLFASLSRYMAKLSRSWKLCLFELLEHTPSLYGCCTIEAQFENFLLDPAKMVENIGPILIVIDALDASGSTEKERERLLGVLSRLPELPPYFRFLITSRPESDICDLLENKSWVYRNELSRCNWIETDLDIGLYVKDCLGNIRTLDKVTIDSLTREIVARSNGIFQWATTACKYIKGDSTIGNSPLDRALDVLKSPSYSSDTLDELYTIILDRLLVSKTEQEDNIISRFQTIMGHILTLRKPLPMDALIGLLSGEEDKKQVQAMLISLGSLLTGVSGGDEPTQPRHLSFADFLTTNSRSGKYWIDMDGQEEKLMCSLFRVTQSLLRFNICELPTSYQSNADVKDLQERIAENIPAYLEYACCYWMNHLEHLPVSPKWLANVEMLMHSHLLFWFEALSLMGKFDLALGQLADLRSWLSPLGDEDLLRLFVDDAHRFGIAFGHVIRHSAPHLYLSALPLIPRSSPISQTYLSKYPGCLDVAETDEIKWPQMLQRIDTGSYISSFAFSPDGRRILSSLSNAMLWIWGTDTGKLVAGPFRGHTDIVTSVGFSPDGKWVVSGSKDKTVRVWNACSGVLVAEPFQGHTEAVRSVGFSPDGKRIVSGSNDGTVRIWDVSTGKLTARTFQGHTNAVLSVGFSPDGNRVVSGSADNTVRIWNTATGKLIVGPFRGNSQVISALFSPGGERIIFCSDDKTIRIWDVVSDKIILTSLLQDHIDHIMSIALSSDGRHASVVSRSHNKAVVMVWDVDSEELIFEFFQVEGNMNLIQSIGFSPTGKKVVSASIDIIQVWDINIAKVSPKGRLLTVSKSVGEAATITHAAMSMSSPSILQSRASSIISFGFSANCQQVVTGSSNGAVLIWSMETGRLITGPFLDHDSAIIQVGFLPDGKSVISGSQSGAITIRNIDTGDIVNFKSSRCSFPFNNSIAFSPDFRWSVSISCHGLFEIWDGNTQILLLESPQPYGSTNMVSSIAFSPDSQQIVYGSYHGIINIWNTNTGKSAANSFKAHKSSISVVGFSPDSRDIVSGSRDCTIRIWNAETGVPVAGPFQGHQDSITSVMFSPDGKRVVSGSDDRTIRVWNASTGELVAGPFLTRTSSVASVAFSPDGNQVISGSHDGIIRVWLISPTLGSISISNPSSNNSDFEFFTKSDVYKTGYDFYSYMCLYEDSGNHLFWIPEHFYPDISSSQRGLLMAANPLRVDVSNFSHGKAWAQCYRP